jgi:hypothetical protein
VRADAARASRPGRRRAARKALTNRRLPVAERQGRRGASDSGRPRLQWRRWWSRQRWEQRQRREQRRRWSPWPRWTAWPMDRAWRRCRKLPRALRRRRWRGRLKPCESIGTRSCAAFHHRSRSSWRALWVTRVASRMTPSASVRRGCQQQLVVVPRWENTFGLRAS